MSRRGLRAKPVSPNRTPSGRQHDDCRAAAGPGADPPPVVGLWRVRRRDALGAALAEEGIRKVDRWTAHHRLATVDFPEEIPGLDPFFNANRPGDLDHAAALLGQAAH